MASEKLYTVYLLTPKNSPFRNHKTYIGFSTNPLRRQRQHNGEISNGAWKTSKYRPWDIICVITGFADKISALKFEWMWQHPYKSKSSRTVLEDHVKGRKGVGKMGCVKRKLIELCFILQNQFSETEGLTLCYYSKEIYDENAANLIALPKNIRLLFNLDHLKPVKKTKQENMMYTDNSKKLILNENSSSESYASEVDGENDLLENNPIDESISVINLVSPEFSNNFKKNFIVPIEVDDEEEELMKFSMRFRNKKYNRIS